MMGDMSTEADRVSALTECSDPWHDDDDAPHREYVYEIADGFRSGGYACLSCGFMTHTIEDADGNYIPPTYWLD